MNTYNTSVFEANPKTKQVICGNCHGIGSVSDSKEFHTSMDCPVCDGDGCLEKEYKVIPFPTREKMPKKFMVRDLTSGNIHNAEFVKNDCVPVARYKIVDQACQPVMSYWTVIKYYELLEA